MKLINVIKLDIHGQESWRYQGRVVNKDSHLVVIEAYFDREDTLVDQLVFQPGDRFVEYYFDNRWFNIYQVFDRDSNQTKGWYCNISFPAQFTDSAIIFQDLALDMLVYPDGHQVVLDQEEFDSLPLSEDLRKAALDGLSELKASFTKASKDGHEFARFLVQKN